MAEFHRVAAGLGGEPERVRARRGRVEGQDLANLARSEESRRRDEEKLVTEYFDKLNGTADWHHQKLQGMPPKGRLMVSAQEADRLKAQALQHLNAGQIDIGAPFLRQYLEYKLGQIIAKLEVHVDAISEAVKLYQAPNRCVLAPQQITDLQDHHTPSIVGNFVSHYETGAGTPFNAYALLGVLQSIDALADCFTYVDQANNQKRFYRRLDRR